ncbi:type III secretion system needle length determinant, SpaN/EivJ family [Chromobacterium vaccinii]|uniref:SpaN/EivJ family type III secretion system needle length determinant n=1 Tax=Chromobacterium vaccinii TaxID=1108595 RepID=UPI000617DC59|nr:type III secretion system needle length determinant, SpaN/EivJ family [Chromobacterium vaccinii]
METVTAAGRWPAALKPEEAEGAASSFARLLSSPDARKPLGGDKPLSILPPPCGAGRGMDAMAESKAAVSPEGGSNQDANQMGADGLPETAGPSTVAQDVFPPLDDEAARNRSDWLAGRLAKGKRLASDSHAGAVASEPPLPAWSPPSPLQLSQRHRQEHGEPSCDAAPSGIRSSERATVGFLAGLGARACEEPSRASSPIAATPAPPAGGRKAEASAPPVMAATPRKASMSSPSGAAGLADGQERPVDGRRASVGGAAVSDSPPALPGARREEALSAAAAPFPPAGEKVAATSPPPIAASAIGMDVAARGMADAPPSGAGNAGFAIGQGAPEPRRAGIADAGARGGESERAPDAPGRPKPASGAAGLAPPGMARGEAMANPVPTRAGRKHHEDAAAAVAGRQDALLPPQAMAASDGSWAPRPRSRAEGAPQSPPKAEPEQSSGIGYRFLRWGGEHAVRIQSRNGKLLLQPSDSLVQQRLSEQWLSGNPQHWNLDRDSGERQSSRPAQDEHEEDA